MRKLILVTSNWYIIIVGIFLKFLKKWDKIWRGLQVIASKILNRKFSKVSKRSLLYNRCTTISFLTWKCRNEDETFFVKKRYIWRTVSNIWKNVLFNLNLSSVYWWRCCVRCVARDQNWGHQHLLRSASRWRHRGPHHRSLTTQKLSHQILGERL